MPDPSQMQQMTNLAALGITGGASANPGDKGWGFKPINQGANVLSATVCGVGSKPIPSLLTGTGRGMFGSASDKTGGFLAQLYDQIKACAQPLGQTPVTSFSEGATGGLRPLTMGGGGFTTAVASGPSSDFQVG